MYNIFKRSELMLLPILMLMQTRMLMLMLNRWADEHISRWTDADADAVTLSSNPRSYARRSVLSTLGLSSSYVWEYTHQSQCSTNHMDVSECLSWILETPWPLHVKRKFVEYHFFTFWIQKIRILLEWQLKLLLFIFHEQFVLYLKNPETGNTRPCGTSI